MLPRAKVRMALDLHPGKAPEDPEPAHVVLIALEAPAALKDQAKADPHQEVLPEMESKMFAETICKEGVPEVPVASTSIHPLAGAGRKVIAVKNTVTTCMVWPKVTLPESPLLAVETVEGAPKRNSPRTRRARTSQVGLLAASPKRTRKTKKGLLCRTLPLRVIMQSETEGTQFMMGEDMPPGKVGMSLPAGK